MGTVCQKQKEESVENESYHSDDSNKRHENLVILGRRKEYKQTYIFIFD